MKTQWPDRMEYPFTSRYIKINNAMMHYIDEGTGPTLLFVHGTPSWSFDFRNVIKQLRRGYRCIAIDHIGFGLSVKPKDYDYSTQVHARTLEEFITAQDLRNITLVLHDFGGPIGFAAALNQQNRIDRIVFLNTWLWSSATDPAFVKLSKVLRSPLIPFLYRYLNFSPRFALPASFGVRKLKTEIRKNYTRPFTKPDERYGPLAFVSSLLNDQNWFESLWERKAALEERQVLIIWGLKDPVIRETHLQKLASGFSRHQTLVLNDCGHFPQEEQPDVVADAIQKFMEETNLK